MSHSSTNSSIGVLVGDVIGASDLLGALGRIKAPGGKTVLFGDQVRPLAHEEITRLRGYSCSAENWNHILVAEHFDPVSCWGSHFMGHVVLGSFKGTVDLGNGVTLPAGVYKSVVADCEIGDGALVYQADIVSNIVVESGAAVWNTKMVAVDAGTTFGNGREISIAIETGEREVKLYAEITAEVAEKITASSADRELLAGYAQFIEDYVAGATGTRGIIRRGAQIRNAGKVINTFVGEDAVIDNVTKVENATILSNPDARTEITDGALVVDSLVQWGCEVGSMAIVEDSVLCEQSCVARHGKVIGSIIGANAVVSGGEVTASLPNSST